MDNYQKALEWLEELASEQKFFREQAAPSLEVTNKLLDALGRPDQQPEYRVVIGGTAGKGTTCRYIEQTLISQGKSVALLTSPELQVINERIRLNGQLVSPAEFATGILHIQKTCEAAQIEPTYYEAIVVAGIYLAAQASVDILICEVGIGGELDAVNAVTGKRIAAVTFIGPDHLEMFGGKMENLAAAKAGIFTKESVLNLSYEQKYRSIFEKNYNKKIIYIKGLKSKMNKKIARKICEQILGSSDFTMHKPVMPARWEKLSENLIIDGAHSAPRFEYILPKIKKMSRPRTGYFGVKENHNPQDLKTIIAEFDDIYWLEFPGSIPARELLTLFKIGKTENIKSFKNKTGLVTGSFRVCAMAREDFYSSEAILDQQSEFPN